MEFPERLGKYQVQALLGRGSMGTVLRAEQEILGRTVALKVLPPDKVHKDRGKLRRFKNEARSVARLFHPNIVTIFDIGTQARYTYFAMQFVDGDSLDEAIESGRLQFEQKLSVFIQLTSAVGFAHRHGVVHRDIKPSNIMIDREGNAHILDFGIAKLEDGKEFTRVGMIVGSAPFMSPEQARGEIVDLRSDIFSLGAVMYNLFTGVKPFRAANKKELILQRMNLKKLPRVQQPQTILELAPEVPTPVVKIIDKCMRPDQVNRYQSDEELSADLERCRVFLSSREKDNSLSRFEFMVREQLNVRELIGPVSLALIIFILGFVVMMLARHANREIPVDEINRLERTAPHRLAVRGGGGR